MELFQNSLNVLVLGSIYVLIAIGLSMIYGILRVLHIAHAGIYTLGAFLSLSFFLATGSFWISLILSAVISGLVGVLIYRYVYYYVLKEKRIVPLIISVGLFITMQDLYRIVYGPYKHPFPLSIPIPSIRGGSFYISPFQMLILIITGSILVVLYFLLNKTRVGVGLKACANDPQMAAAVGINTKLTISLAFFIGSALAAIAGTLVGVYHNNVYPTMGSMVSYKAFVVVVLGGFGSLKGSVVAGFLLAAAEVFLVAWKGFFLPRDTIGFLIMILFLIFLPNGLFGKEER